MPTLVTILWCLLFVDIILLAWIYFGYGIFVRIKKLHRAIPENIDKSYTPRITVIIPTHNEERTIENKIRNTISVDYPANLFEIIVVDDCSTDRTISIVQEMHEQRIRCIVKEQRSGKAASINLAIQNTSAEFVVITDADVLISKNAFRSMCQLFQSPNIGAVNGQIQVINQQDSGVANGAAAFWQNENAILAHESYIDSQTYLQGSLFLMRRSLLQSLPLDTGNVSEDFDLAIRIRRLGLRVLAAPKVTFTTVVPVTSSTAMVQRSRTALGTVYTLSKHYRVVGNPRYGFFGVVALTSHKLGQILSPILLFLVGSKIIILFMIDYAHAMVMMIALALFGFFGMIFMVKSLNLVRLLQTVRYFFLLQFIMLVGWWKFLRKDIQVTWQQVQS